MPTPTYTPLANLTLSSSASSVTFSSIPATYRDLRIVIAGTTSAGVNTVLRFNSDSGNNYTGVLMYGTGSGSGTSGTFGAGSFAYFGALWTGQGNNTVDIMDYSATDKHKTLISRYNSAANEVGAMASRWASTSAVNSITILTASAATYASGTTFAIYGIAS